MREKESFGFILVCVFGVAYCLLGLPVIAFFVMWVLSLGEKAYPFWLLIGYSAVFAVLFRIIRNRMKSDEKRQYMPNKDVKK